MEPFLGQITLFAFDFAPLYWAPCAGQLLPVNQNPALFALLGTNFGGDGRTTFALPDLRGKKPVSSTQYCIALQGIFPSRN
ncbi:MAG: tail fiber protein [Anaerolineae bacterium]|jgi:microcystin-dependent protein|uniref:phage tail protein n=1 Tax=Candidatus Amarolinea dominans TaxID=3140696 RepID=UPI001D397F55|nr:tail fiber protein [Anaerolineae bacterium]MBK7203820.1 tail fiber protein [Anaerolineae bacterium]MBK9091608.1 tail fiber protein [Anaerolineae bacterium]MBK9230307.1 tail fiber protein [Anaerolineae bacterium]